LVYYLFATNTLFSEAIELFEWEAWKFLIVAGVTSIIGQIGDLIASALKRSARIKDYGTLFPGHGGVMDRVDGLMFNATLIYVIFTLFLV
jgi:phosphatidate cytidylyltransferase